MAPSGRRKPGDPTNQGGITWRTDEAVVDEELEVITGTCDFATVFTTFGAAPIGSTRFTATAPGLLVSLSPVSLLALVRDVDIVVSTNLAARGLGLGNRSTYLPMGPPLAPRGVGVDGGVRKEAPIVLMN